MVKRYVGVDTGGTFTDFVEINEYGQVAFDKAFSTPQEPELGIMNVLQQYAVDQALPLEQFLQLTERFAHGSTVSTNALIERKGARVGLLTTRGFEDTLYIARGPIGRTGGLPYLQAMNFIQTEIPKPIVSKQDIRGIAERITGTGEIIAAIDREQVKQAMLELIEQGVQSLAVCLLWSFRNPLHEQIVKEIAAEIAPGIPISLSSEISPSLGEFERMVTTVVNAFISPVMERYTQSLSRKLQGMSFNRNLQIMKSSGGLLLPNEIHKQAVATINSGPVGGLVASRCVGKQLGYDNIITADMGGTSFDVGLIADGQYEEEKAPFLDQGLPVQISAVKIVTIGAGGGSIARTDGHRLVVGPQSAGASPGPVCYGAGNQEPTVTDALVALGIIDPQSFFGGRRVLNADLAKQAIEEKIAKPLGLDVLQAAAGIYEVITAKMSDLIRKMTVESGYDPRNFCILSYGGATGAHCATFAKQLGIDKVIIPHAASVFSAYGIALSDVMYTYAKSEPTVLQDNEACLARINRLFADLKEKVIEDMAQSGIPENELQLNFKIDLRYIGQMNEVTINWPQGYVRSEDIGHIYEAFETLYQQKFGRGTTRKETPMELIHFRAEAVKITEKPKLTKIVAKGVLGQSPRPRSVRHIYVHGQGQVKANIYDFTQLSADCEIVGPAVIERRDTTIWVCPGTAATVDEYGNTIIRTGGNNI